MLIGTQGSVIVESQKTANEAVMARVKLEYEISSTSISEFTRAVADVCSELDQAGHLRDQAKQVGLDLNDQPNFHLFAQVEPAGHGFDPATVAAIVTLSLPFAKAGAKVTEQVLRDIWKKVVLPRVLQRIGDGSLTEVEAEDGKRNRARPSKGKE